MSQLGGGYNSQASSTFVQTTVDAWNGSAESEGDALYSVPSIYFNDVLTVSGEQKLPGFPVGIQSNALLYGALGLGKNSTFINRLVEAAFAPSRSFSMFPGMYSDAGVGSLMIGGYADRFYTGQLYTKNISDALFCPSCFNITGMTFDSAAGSVDLMPNRSLLLGYIDPYYPTLILPDDSLYAFGNATNGTFNSYYAAYEYASGDVPRGNITITLKDGLTTTIPHKAIFDPPAYDNGILQVNRNNSAVYALVQPWTAYSTSNLASAAILGVPYAAFVYLIRDYERKTLSIANANQEAQISGDATTICPLTASGGSKSHTGAIAGGVVGGVVGLLLILALAWFLWRRNKKRKAASPSTVAAPGTDGKAEVEAVAAEKTNGSALPVHADHKVPEAAGHQIQPTQELSGEADTETKEMAGDQVPPPQELPTEGKVIRSELPA